MALVEVFEYQTEVLPISKFHQVQVRRSNIIKDDVSGEIKSTSFHRHVLAPGDDISGEPAEVQAVCGAIWTDELADAYRAYLATLSAGP